MSWFSNNQVPAVELENKINETTSESIPNGELDLSVALEITDIIRSKIVPPKQCMRSLKKRLSLVYLNPNLLTSTLKLVDLSVKNGGYHFLVELSSKEFIDYLIDFIFMVHYNTKNRATSESNTNIGNLILSLIQEWKIYFENQVQLGYVERRYNELLNQGYVFPKTNFTLTLNSKFIDSEAPPDWVDSNECMICYTPFSMMNRKHHCRSCGGVYCQTHSSHSSPLVSLGIMTPVRVCDNCHEKIKFKKGGNHPKHETRRHSRQTSNVGEEDEDLKRAIELSLKDGVVPINNIEHNDNGPPPLQPNSIDQTNNNDEEDDEIKAAIAASLKDYQDQEKLAKQKSSAIANQEERPLERDGFYSKILPSFENETSTKPVSPIASQNTFDRIKSEDLLPKEEEQVNLYISLLSQVRNDPVKQQNILYDSDLNELHTQITRVKPKLNKSLRVSIERYEAFLELNNKISSITRLYDQFLESKLNFAYGNHQISSPSFQAPGQPSYAPRSSYSNVSTNPNYDDRYTYGAQQSLSGQDTGYSNYVSQQSTGFDQSQLFSQPTAQVYGAPEPYDGTRYATSPYPKSDRRESNTSPPNTYAQYNYGTHGSPEAQLSMENRSSIPSSYTYDPTLRQVPSEPVYTDPLPEENEPEPADPTGRFPTIEAIERGQTESTTRKQDELPSLPNLPDPDISSQKAAQRRAPDPEPLIEL